MKFLRIRFAKGVGFFPTSPAWSHRAPKKCLLRALSLSPADRLLTRVTGHLLDRYCFHHHRPPRDDMPQWGYPQNLKSTAKSPITRLYTCVVEKIFMDLDEFNHPVKYPFGVGPLQVVIIDPDLWQSPCWNFFFEGGFILPSSSY